ncbi:MAG: hypothetical protein JWO51_4990 [Rhodospirillales bacterium]|nr:hypothetical protein [Rhodospirillales bacterium]
MCNRLSAAAFAVGVSISALASVANAAEVKDYDLKQFSVKDFAGSYVGHTDATDGPCKIPGNYRLKIDPRGEASMFWIPETGLQLLGQVASDGTIKMSMCRDVYGPATVFAAAPVNQ